SCSSFFTNFISLTNYQLDLPIVFYLFNLRGQLRRDVYSEELLRPEPDRHSISGFHLNQNRRPSLVFGNKIAQQFKAPGRDGALRHFDYNRPGGDRPGSLQMVNLLGDDRRAAFVGEFEPPPNEHHFVGLKQVFIPVELLRPADYFHGSVLILEPKQRKAISLLRDLRRQINDDSSQRDLSPMRGFFKVTAVKPRQSLDGLRVILQRMAAGIEPQGLFLESQAFFLAPPGDRGKNRFLDGADRRVSE